MENKSRIKHISDDGENEKYISAVMGANTADAKDGINHHAYVYTFGCQQNEADSEKIRGICEKMGYSRAENAEGADLIIVNTCAVREHAENRALSMLGELKHVKEKNRDTIIGVCGCMAARKERAQELKSRYPAVDFSLEPNSIYRIPELVYRKRFDIRYKRTFVTSEDDIGDLYEGLPVVRESGHRAWVSIMYGCNNFCSYCIVPYVRGRERSRNSEDVLSEVSCLIRSGCKDITLLGQNVNSYKSDCDFPGLLSKILGENDGEYIIRFMSSHPKDVSDELIDVMANSHGHIEPHFHLPLQSGSDRVLKAMNRKYDTSKYLETVRKLRDKMPDITLTGDIIVGFPTETEEDFADTLKVLSEVKFDMIYSFIYSRRSGTPASNMEQVADDVKKERMSRLLALQDKISQEKNLPLTGKTLRVLVDGKSRENESVYSGRTDAGKLVHFDGCDEDIGKYRYVKITRAEPYVLYGNIVLNRTSER